MMKNKMTIRKSFKINFRAIKLMFKEYPLMFISKLLCVIWNSLTPYVSIYLSALIIDEIATNKDKERLKLLILITLLSSVFIALIKAILNRWMSIQNNGRYFKNMNIFNKKILEMDYEKCDDTKTYDLLSTILQNQNGGGWGINRVFYQFDGLVSSIFTIGGGIVLSVSLFTLKVPESNSSFLFLNNPIFVLIIVSLMLIFTFLSPILQDKGRNLFAKNASSHRFGNRLFGFFGFLGYRKDVALDVRIYKQEKICEKHNTNKEDIFGSNGKFAHLALGPVGLCAAASSFLSVVFTGIVYTFVCLKAWAGAFGLGLITQYIASISSLSGGLSSFVSNVGDMYNNSFFLEQVFEFLDIPNDMYQGSLTVEKRNDYNYEVEFKNVSFKYPGTDNYVLKNINAKFKIGEKLAIVGMNGSGKTTFIKLLCRLYDPTEGEILLNGINIRKYNYDDYMMIFSVVFQDFNLFSLTLGENVSGATNYNKELAIDCLNKAGFSDRLKKMEKGIDTYLYKDYDKDGVDVSGGEAQKIAIARSLYKDAPFIILDEPTATLDPIAEAEIYSKFNEIVGDKTAIYISHRLSSCKFCDEIMVFHEGEVIQQGTHDALLENINGKYYELWNAQAQYYNE